MATQTDIVVAAGAPEPASPINWGAIIAGAIVAAVATLILTLVGSGLGLTMISPWSPQSASATTVLAWAAVWLVIVQWVSSCLGGYMAGRFRRRWTGIHTDEVVFRDSAHGLLAWSVATLVMAGLLGSAISGIIGSGGQVASNVAAGAAHGISAGATAAGGVNNPSTGYFVDALFRPADPARLNAPGAQGDAAAIGQATRILVTSTGADQLSNDDKNYLATLVAARTGLSQPDAQKRVDSVWAKVEEAKTKIQAAANKARKTSAATALLGTLTLFIGAFIAAVSAVLGGKLRDEDEDRWSLSS
jgi:hypothetical protein